MRIGIFSDLYPPLFIGGYEIGARQIVQELQRRGHETLVLSAHQYYLMRHGGFLSFKHAPADREKLVDVGLCVLGRLPRFMRQHKLRFLYKMFKTLQARRRYRRALREFRPDALLVFNPLGVVAPVMDDFVEYSRETGTPVTCYISDHWLGHWPAANPLWVALSTLRQSPQRWIRFLGNAANRVLHHLKMLPNGLPLIDQYLYCSQFIENVSQYNAIGVAGHAVVHWGLPDADQWRTVPPTRFLRERPLTLVFAGQVEQHKGLDLIIRAMARCRREHELVVIGDDSSEFGGYCKRIAERLEIAHRVRFLGKRDPKTMPDTLREAGEVLVVPSVWDEPFSIVVLEGMALGMSVIASRTGGTGEAIEDGRTGFLFSRYDFKELARIIDRLEEDRRLCQRVSTAARNRVLQRFMMRHMVDEIIQTGLFASRDEVLAGPAKAPVKLAPVGGKDAA
jgi:glycosyltransferase involved in cell wall biosynthesis